MELGDLSGGAVVEAEHASDSVLDAALLVGVEAVVGADGQPGSGCAVGSTMGGWRVACAGGVVGGGLTDVQMHRRIAGRQGDGQVQGAGVGVPAAGFEQEVAVGTDGVGQREARRRWEGEL